MKYKKRIFIVLLLFIIGFTIFRYGLIVILYLTTPPNRDVKNEERIFVDSLRNVCNCDKIKIEPVWGNNVKNKRPYYIIFSNYKAKIIGDSLEKESFRIAKKAFAIQNKVTQEFDRYQVVYETSKGEFHYEYTVDEFK